MGIGVLKIKVSSWEKVDQGEQMLSKGQMYQKHLEIEHYSDLPLK